MRAFLRGEIDRHLSEWYQIERIRTKHPDFCTICQLGEHCIDALRLQTLCEGLAEWEHALVAKRPHTSYRRVK